MKDKILSLKRRKIIQILSTIRRIDMNHSRGTYLAQVAGFCLLAVYIIVHELLSYMGVFIPTWGLLAFIVLTAFASFLVKIKSKSFAEILYTQLYLYQSASFSEEADKNREYLVEDLIAFYKSDTKSIEEWALRELGIIKKAQFELTRASEIRELIINPNHEEDRK